jgi:hypothetical protein
MNFKTRNPEKSLLRLSGFLAFKFILFLFISSAVQAEPLAPNDLKSLLNRIREKRAAAP